MPGPTPLIKTLKLAHEEPLRSGQEVKERLNIKVYGSKWALKSSAFYSFLSLELMAESQMWLAKGGHANFFGIPQIANPHISLVSQLANRRSVNRKNIYGRQIVNLQIATFAEGAQIY